MTGNPQPVSTPALLEQALQLHRQGLLGEAELRYRRILAAQPRHPDALHLLGMLAMSAGHFEDGIDLMQRSLDANSSQPAVLLNLARACMQTGRREQALTAYDRVLTLQPDLPEALFERANACLLSQQPQAALEGYDRLLRRMPSHADAWSNRGNALQELGQAAEAVRSYDRALALQPGAAGAHNNRGNALRALGQLQAALASYDQALRLDPQLANAHNNRGLTLSQQARLEEALTAFERATALAPQFADAHNNRGNILRELGRPAAALESYDRVLEIDPTYAEAHSNRGNALRDLERYEDALRAYDRALLALPGKPDILANRAAVLADLMRHDAAAECLQQLLRQVPRYDYALGGLLQSDLHLCMWERYDELLARATQALRDGHRVIHPFTAMAVLSSAGTQLRAAQLHASATAIARVVPGAAGGPEPVAAAVTASAASATARRIRLAYVSADFREHAASYLLAGVFEQHDRQRFETFAISLRPPEETPMGRRVAAAFDRFEDVSGRNDPQVATLMRELRIDIAVDLMGYTHKARPALFAQRAAPVHVSYLGYPGTMGAPFMDYILADPFVIPPESRRHYSEQVVYLPGCFQVNDDRCVVGPIPSRESVGLPARGLVFCCINSNYKINPPMFDIWMRLLRDVPGSVLWLLADRDITQQNLRRQAQARGVSGERLVFAARLPYAQHLGRLSLADLFLDTLPYNAGTTASDALRVGVPVLTCAGDAFASRMAGSLLHALGLPELVTHSLPEYEHAARELTREPQKLHALQERLARNRSGALLFDTARMTRHLESAYMTMHERASLGEPPEAFSVR